MPGPAVAVTGRDKGKSRPRRRPRVVLGVAHQQGRRRVQGVPVPQGNRAVFLARERMRGIIRTRDFHKPILPAERVQDETRLCAGFVRQDEQTLA